MVTALTCVAIALFFIGIVLCALGWVVIKSLAVIWDDLAPLLHHGMILKRMDMRLMIEDAGYVCPEWLKDEDDDDTKEKNEIIRLVPKPKQDNSE